MDDLKYRLGLDGSQFDGVMSRSIGGVGKLGSALAALGVIGVLGGIVKQGFAFNKSMRDSEIAIAQVLRQFKGLDAQAAKGEAAAAMQQLIDLEPKAAGSLRDLTGGFLATLAASQSAGLSVQQNIDLVGRFANAMANAALPTEQLSQEMRSIVTANIGADSSLARILGITNEMVNQAREAGTLYQFLTDKIGTLGEAGDSAAVAFSSLESAIDKAAGALTAGLFSQAVDGSKSLTETINGNIAAFERWGAAISRIGKTAAESLTTIDQWSRAIGLTAGMYYQMFTNGLSYTEALEAAQKALTEEINATGKAAAAVASTPAAPASTLSTGSTSSSKSGSADTSRRKAESMQLAREQILAEVQIAEANAKGQDKKAKALERELFLRTETLRIIRETGATEQQAASLAERLANAKEGPEKDANGRTKIRSRRDGSTLPRQSGRFGSLDDLARLNTFREVGFDERQAVRKQRGGGSGLPIGQSDAFVPVFRNDLSSRGTSNQVRRSLSGPNSSLSSRTPGDPKAHSLLTQTVEELRRIRT